MYNNLIDLIVELVEVYGNFLLKKENNFFFFFFILIFEYKKRDKENFFFEFKIKRVIEVKDLYKRIIYVSNIIMICIIN